MKKDVVLLQIYTVMYYFRSVAARISDPLSRSEHQGDNGTGQAEEFVREADME